MTWIVKHGGDIRDNQDILIAHIYDDPSLDTGVVEYNARLIAAAPRMLALLKLMVLGDTYHAMPAEMYAILRDVEG